MYFEKIDENIYRFEDTCNVYAIRYGMAALLIDFGSGEILDHLPEIGISRIGGVCLTTPHRNHCQGLGRLDAGVLVYWPDGSREVIEQLTVSHDNPVLYPSFPGVYELPAHVPEKMPVLPVLTCGKYSVSRVRIGGHIACQTVYFADCGRKRICFSGEAMAAPGKIHGAYHLEHRHHTGSGQYEGVEALRQLRLLRPDVLCPAHGIVMRDDIWNGITLTMDKLRALAELYDTNCPGTAASTKLPFEDGDFKRLSEHLWMRGNMFFVLAEPTKMLLMDFYETDARFDDFVALFKKSFPEVEIEMVLISHIHYDHWQNIEKLRTVFPKLKTGATANIAECLENPLAFKRPFQRVPGMKVDRTFRHGEIFRWRNHIITAYEFPGQTDKHDGFLMELDGKKIFLSGDNFYPAQQWGGTGGLSSLNGGDPVNGWRKSIDLLLELAPDWIIAGHTFPFVFDRKEFMTRRQWSYDVERAMREIAAEDPWQLGFNQQLFAAYPFIQPAQKNGLVVLRIGNPSARTVKVGVTAVPPDSVVIEKPAAEVVIDAGGTATAQFNFACSIPVPGNTMIAFDIVYDGRHYGEITECYLY